MKLFLDTHVVLWALRDPDRLSAPARDAIADPRNELLVSAVCGLEVATKVRLGKLDPAASLVSALPAHLEDIGARQVPLTLADGLVAGSLAWPHRDPFDRALAAQAIRIDAELVTRDGVFATLPAVRTLW